MAVAPGPRSDRQMTIPVTSDNSRYPEVPEVVSRMQGSIPK
jgi:hypothetical protein